MHAHRYDAFYTHRRSRRLAGHDYASAGWYFVTICTKGRRCLFGEIRRGIMGLNALGCVAHACWAAIPDHHARVCLDAFVVMPNHVHGLIGIWPPVSPMAPAPVAPLHATALRPEPPPPPGTHPPRPEPPPPDTHPPPPKPGSLAVVVRSYKSAVTRTVRRMGAPFAWQPRFHDHIVRHEQALFRIRAYIQHNPAAWQSDTFHAPQAS